MKANLENPNKELRNAKVHPIVWTAVKREILRLCLLPSHLITPA